jgi:uncharacterized protein YndB with AHSA1/START domain
VRATIDIAAPAAEVFRALVDPRELAAWLGGESSATDPRDDDPSGRPVRPLPGSLWRAPAIAPDGTTGTVTGEYLSVVPPHRLESTWRASWNDFTTERVRFELVPIDVGGAEGTRVTVTHTRATSRLHATRSTLSHTAGAPENPWPSLLAQLATHVATMSALAHWAAPHDGAAVQWFDALHRAVVDTHHAH